MPDYNVVYLTKRGAEQGLADCKRELSDQLRQDSTEFEDKTTFEGSAKDGYVEVYNCSTQYIEITVCDMKDCCEVED